MLLCFCLVGITGQGYLRRKGGSLLEFFSHRDDLFSLCRAICIRCTISIPVRSAMLRMFCPKAQVLEKTEGVEH